MDIVEMYQTLKDIADASGLVTNTKLIKSGDDVTGITEEGEYRRLLVTAQSANLYKEDNDISFHIMILDKTDEDDVTYLHSVNDGIALIRSIIDSLALTYGNRVSASELSITSGKDEDHSLITSIECDLSFEFNIIP
jgi:hypothetical protein